MSRYSQYFCSLALVGVALLALAAPAQADDYWVSNTADAGDGSLRQAILDANAHPGADTIRFVDGFAGQINLTSGHLLITEDVTIEGPGAKTLAVDAGQLSRVLRVQAGKATLRGLTLRNGRCPVGEDGGGIFLVSVTSLTLEECAITGNAVPELVGVGRDGGGIYTAGSNTLVARRCLFADNVAEYGGGGAVYLNSHTTTTLENCTFARNRAGGQSSVAGLGGAIFQALGASLTLESCTVTANTAGSLGGGVGVAERPTVHNCLIAGNTAPTGPDVRGSVTSQGYNLIGNTTSSSWAASDLLNVDPMLGDLADNGGPTQTCALLPGSPALNAADPTTFPTTDQRGIARPQGGRADIGAFEFQPIPVALDVSTQVQVMRDGLRFNRTTGRYVQTITLKNIGTATITGPVSLVLDNLSSNAALYNKTGTTLTGSSYLNTAGDLAPGASIMLTLEFTNPTNGPITYTTRVLAGPGIR